ncbi:MAG: hypothetical protein K0R82_2695, partial [Flavipsychrobacter sp.]|nr:hypothetical protein [Flavipsychrobacter sp.]
MIKYLRDVKAFFYVIFSLPWVSILIMWGLYFSAAIIMGYLPWYENPEPTEIFGEAHFPIIPVLLILYLLSWLTPVLFIFQCIFQPFSWLVAIVSFFGFLF